MQHDAHYKRLLSHPRMTGDLLRLLQIRLGERFPVLNRVQPETLERLPAEFITDVLRQRFADLVWKVRLSEPAETARSAASGPPDTPGEWQASIDTTPAQGDDHADRSDNDEGGNSDYGGQRAPGAPSTHGKRHVHADRNGRWLYLVVLLEFQSTEDWIMAMRVRDYATQLFFDMHKRRPFGRNRAPPPILPVVLYNGSRRWNAPTRADDLWHPERASRDDSGFGDVEAGPLQFSGDGFVLIDLPLLGHSALPDDSGITWLARAESLDDDEALFATLDRVIRWLDDVGDGTLATAILEWLRASSESRNLVTAEEFDMAIEEAKRIKRPEGHWVERVYQDRLRRMAKERAEGEAEGREAGLAEGLERARTLLARQLARRFGADAAARLSPVLEQADHDRLIEIGDWVVDSRDAEELLQHCPSPDA